MRIRITKDVWDDGADHHPPALLARSGAVLNVLECLPDGYEVARNGRFYVSKSECEPIASSSAASPIVEPANGS